MSDHRIGVYADWLHDREPMQLGLLDARAGRTGEIFEFALSKDALGDPQLARQQLDPDINVMASNTDDHLRNHGFLLTPNGWRLSPAYDMNPNPDSLGLALDIDDSDNALDLDLARSVAPYFRVRDPDATIKRMYETVAGWRETAAKLGITGGEQDMMAPAFRATK